MKKEANLYDGETFVTIMDAHESHLRNTFETIPSKTVLIASPKCSATHYLLV